MKNLTVLSFQKTFNSLILFLIWSVLSAFTFQGDDKSINQRVFNTIEFFISQHQTDSIYQLAAPSFKQAVPFDNFKNILNTQIYPMGKIVNSKQVEFDSAKKTAKYRVEFQGLTLQILLGLDANRKFNTFAIQPYSPSREENLPVILSTPKDQRVEAIVRELANSYIRQPQTKGLAIATLSPSGIKEYYFGQKSVQDANKPDGNSVFEIGSITKTFTAGILAYLVHNQKIQLEDRIIHYLPDSLKQVAGLQNITFKSLANHTSGLPRLPSNLDKTPGFQESNPYMLYDEAALFQFLNTLNNPFDEYPDYEYSNLGYGLLGILLEKVSGLSYPDLIGYLITQPLQMSKTVVSRKEGDSVLPVYTSEGKATPVWDFDAIAAAGGIKSSLPDMIQYAKAQLRTPFNNIETAFTETRQFTFFIPPDTDIGLAWHINLLGDHLVYWHNGGTGGSRSYIGLSPDNKTGVIILSNCNESVDKMGVQILENLLK